MSELKGVSLERTKVTLGSDPEIFVMAGKKLLPAFEFLPPKEKSEYGNLDAGYPGRSRQFWDGFQAEWEFEGGYSCIIEMMHGIRGSLKRLEQSARELNKKAELSLKSVVKIPKATMKDTPEMFAAFGCMPSYNAYQRGGKKIDDPKDLLYRFAGGHIHLGCSLITKPKVPQIVKMLDRVLGVWAVGAAANWDDPIRRKYYGLAGEFRVPGENRLEYRTLSNFWLSHPAIFSATMEIARQAVRFAASEHTKAWITSDDETQEAINNCNVGVAREILERNREVFAFIMSNTGADINDQLPTMYALSKSQVAAKMLHRVGMEGIEILVETPDSIRTNWSLDGMAYEWYEHSGSHQVHQQNPPVMFSQMAEAALGK